MKIETIPISHPKIEMQAWRRRDYVTLFLVDMPRPGNKKKKTAIIRVKTIIVIK